VCDPALDRALGDGTTGPDLTVAGDLVADLALRVPLVRPGLLLAEDGVDLTGIRRDRVDPAPITVSDVLGAAPTWRRSG